MSPSPHAADTVKHIINPETLKLILNIYVILHNVIFYCLDYLTVCHFTTKVITDRDSSSDSTCLHQNLIRKALDTYLQSISKPPS